MLAYANFPREHCYWRCPEDPRLETAGADRHAMVQAVSNARVATAAGGPPRRVAASAASQRSRLQMEVVEPDQGPDLLSGQSGG